MSMLKQHLMTSDNGDQFQLYTDVSAVILIFSFYNLGKPMPLVNETMTPFVIRGLASRAETMTPFVKWGLASRAENIIFVS